MKAYWPVFETGSICKNIADKSFRYGHAFYSAPEAMAVDAGARRRSGHWVWLLLKAANKREVSVRVRYEGPVGFREHLVTKFPGARAGVEAMGDAVRRRPADAGSGYVVPRLPQLVRRPHRLADKRQEQSLLLPLETAFFN